MDKKPVYEKMSKSRGNVVLPEEVVYGVCELDSKYEFRDFLGEVVDYKEMGVWQDKLNTGFFFTATRFKREPVWLCEKNNFDAEGKPIPLVLLIDGEEKIQHPEELDKVKYYVLTQKMFTSTGRLRYSPKLNGSLNRRDGGSTKWWLVIDCDPEIGRYYRSLYSMWMYKTSELRRPAWETHISVIRDEKPPNEAAWMKYEGEAIEFSYTPSLEFNGIYVWLPVVCERALDIREELGLSRNPFYNLHMTVGNRKEELNFNGELE